MRLVSFKIRDPVRPLPGINRVDWVDLRQERLDGILAGIVYDRSLNSFSSFGTLEWPHNDLVVVDLTSQPFELSNDWAHNLGKLDLIASRLATLDIDRCRVFESNQVSLGPPIVMPPKFMAVGLNYRDHIQEMGAPLPEHLVWFSKAHTCVTGPFDPIKLPRVSDKVDYEGELAIVIGKSSSNLTVAQAESVIAGYTVVNDVSVRDWQSRSSQFTIGKGFDTHGPIGPWIVTQDEVGDPASLEIITRVNSEVRQKQSCSSMVFGCLEMVSELSCAMTLEPGDIIATGTPAGVGTGFNPPKWLKPGDKVEVEISSLGKISNRVVGPRKNMGK